ncbi:TPA: methionine-binding protein [Neisseria subflava]|nr:methionine-binding protein [Neisseria meningitidis]
MKTAVLSAALFLSACVYTETPYGRTAVLDLPVHSQTTVNKTVTINAPPGTTVIYQDSEPVRNYPAYPVYPRRVYRYR